jgi:hypothetical protein
MARFSCYHLDPVAYAAASIITLEVVSCQLKRGWPTPIRLTRSGVVGAVLTIGCIPMVYYGGIIGAGNAAAWWRVWPWRRHRRAQPPAEGSGRPEVAAADDTTVKAAVMLGVNWLWAGAWIALGTVLLPGALACC